MTAIAARRRRATMVAAISAVVGVGAVGGLAYAGVQTIYDSRAGRLVGADPDLAPAVALPFTSTALVATVTETGVLTSVEVLVLEPDGTGGSIISVSPSADSSSGSTTTLQPLRAAYAVDGPTALLEAAEGLTGLAFDVAEVIDGARFADLVRPLGRLSVDLPTELRDTATGVRYPPGLVDLTPDAAAAAVLSLDPGIDDWYLDAGRSAVWAAVADGVGAGIGNVPEYTDAASETPRTLDEFLTRLFAGRVEHRRMTSKPINEDRVASQLDDVYADSYGDAVVSVVAHDRAELLLVLGAVAPARLGAPYEGPTFRVLSGFGPDLLSALDANNADVARQAINRLLFAQANVVSFGQPDDVPALTLIEVADPAALASVEATFGTLFGESVVRDATERIAGVDVQVTLGLSYLDTVDRSDD